MIGRPSASAALLCLTASACTVAVAPAPAQPVAVAPAPDYQAPPPNEAPPPQPPAPPRTWHTIHVIAGSYGQNCRAAYGNVTPHLRQTCEGVANCAYVVDYKVIGDPAYGCQKDYVAEWLCGRDPAVRRATAAPEAGFGSVVQLTCEGGAAADLPPPPPPPPHRHRPIHVVAGSYGQNCRAAYGNTTPHLQQSCEGRTRCVYRIDYKVIGDPAYGCAKDYVAEWRCGDEPGVRRAVAAPEAGFGKTVELACD
jgi:hypothetical protein